MKQYDVIVVGGGPIGSYIAQMIAAKGISVAIIEEHKTIGEPLHCAGLVTERIFKITNCPHTSIVQHKISGAHIHAPDGTTLAIGTDKIHALVINRQRFDETLAQKARAAGASLLLEHKVTTAKQQEHHVLLETQHHEKTTKTCCKLLIGADGSHSTIRTCFNFPPPTEIIHGIGAELADTTLDPHFVHIYVGQHIAPGFFAWIIPLNAKGTQARIGLGIRKKSPHPLQHYFTILLNQPLLKDTTITKHFGGTIPLGPLNKTVDTRVMLVGDAAAHIKPTSGGGLYPGLLCAQHCATTAIHAVHTNRFNTNVLKYYHTAWTKDIGRELALGMTFRRLFTRLNDKQITKYIKKFSNKKIIDVINTYGDIDYPSQLALPLIRKSPSLLSLAPTLLKRIKH
jgi:geranylgeranyl reductase family protein